MFLSYWQIHIADLRSKYAPVGLDLVELRAVWHILPDWQRDTDPEKEEWKNNFRLQMEDLERREEAGTAAEHLKRNVAYEVPACAAVMCVIVVLLRAPVCVLSWQGLEPLRVYSSNSVIRRRYSTFEVTANDSAPDATCGDTAPSRARADSNSLTTPSEAGTAGGREQPPILTSSPSSVFRHSSSCMHLTDSSACIERQGICPPVPLHLYRPPFTELAPPEPRGSTLPVASAVSMEDKEVSLLLTKEIDACRKTPAVLSVLTDDDLENMSPQALIRPRSLMDVHARRLENPEKARSSSSSPRQRSLSGASMMSTAIGSENSSYRQRREGERRRRMHSGSADKGSGDESWHPSVGANGGAKRVADLRKSGSRGRACSDSSLRVLERSMSAPSSPTRALGGNDDRSRVLKQYTVAKLFSSNDHSEVHVGDDDESESDDSAAVTLWGDESSVLVQKYSNAYVGEAPMMPKEALHVCSTSTASPDARANCHPRATRVPFFFQTPTHAADGTTRLSISPVPMATSCMPVRAARASSCGTSTALCLSRCTGFEDPNSTSGDHSAPPSLSATTLRDLLSTMDSCAVAERVQQSTLSMSPSEATDLLKYALVNFCVLGCDVDAEDRARLENGIILTVNSLVERCSADVNAVDRDGNSLLTFILMHSHASTGDTDMGVSKGICALIRHLVYHGINIFTSCEGMEIVHEGFLRLQSDDLQWLAEMFRAQCGITVDGEVDTDKKILTNGQYRNFLVVLVVTGQFDAAAFLLDLEVVTVLPVQASALMKACKFESMDNPVETYEFLEQYGGQLQ